MQSEISARLSACISSKRDQMNEMCIFRKNLDRMMDNAIASLHKVKVHSFQCYKSLQSLYSSQLCRHLR